MPECRHISQCASIGPQKRDPKSESLLLRREIRLGTVPQSALRRFILEAFRLHLVGIR
jgi:hypothetical protein